MKNLFILFLLIVFCTMASCSKTKNEMNNRLQATILEQSQTTMSEPPHSFPVCNEEMIYDRIQLDKIYNHRGTIEALLTDYPTKYVRWCFDSVWRCVFYGSENENLITVVFNSEGEFLFSNEYCAEATKTAFEQLQIGDSLYTVQAISPNGTYYFLHTGANKPATSDHYTEDKFFVRVTYDDSFCVESVLIEPLF